MEVSVLDDILERLTRLDEAVRGNGKPGLRHEVVELRTALANCQARRDLEREQAGRTWNRFFQPAVAIVYGGVAALLLAGFMAFMTSSVEVNVQEQIRRALQQVEVPAGEARIDGRLELRGE